MTTQSAEVPLKSKTRRSFVAASSASLIFLLGRPRKAKAQCTPSSFEQPIFTAGRGESLIGALPTPIPYPIRSVKSRFRNIAHGILTVRSLAFEGNIEAALVQKDVLIQQSLRQLSFLTDGIALLPTPLPSPGDQLPT